MTYLLEFESRIGLWRLEVNRCRARFYRTRDAAMKCVTRYRRMLQSESERCDR
jgi:hypothetical protein